MDVSSYKTDIAASFPSVSDDIRLKMKMGWMSSQKASGREGRAERLLLMCNKLLKQKYFGITSNLEVM